MLMRLLQRKYYFSKCTASLPSNSAEGRELVDFVPSVFSGEHGEALQAKIQNLSILGRRKQVLRHGHRL